MCGIVGILAHGSFETPKEEKIRQEAIRYITTELLLLTQARGKDATGLSVCFDDGDYMGLKMGVSAQEFISRFGGKETDYDGFVKVWRKKKTNAKMVIGHCRKPSTTIGAGTEDNTNNHPIKVGDIVGVHNGTLRNHEIIFKNLGGKQDGKVDSEAIFRLLDHYTHSGTEPFTMEAIQETCNRLAGEYAVLTYNGNNPYQMAAFRDRRPIEFLLIRPLKLLVIASEVNYLKMVLTRYNRMSYLYQAGAAKFPELKKADVELKNSVDSTAYLFNTEQDITPETKLEDLIIEQKIPFGNKKWTTHATKSATGNTNNGNVMTGYNPATAAKKMSEVVVKSPDGAAAGPQSAQMSYKKGMVWNEDKGKFSSINPDPSLKKHDNVLITADQAEVTGLTSGKILSPAIKEKKDSKHSCDAGNQKSGCQQDLFDLTVTYDNVAELLSDPTKIKLLEIEDVIEPRTTKAHTTKPREITEVDISIDPEALEIATKEAANRKNFSNVSDVAAYVEVPNARTVENMELHSLINRFQKYLYREAFYEGYLACKKEATPATSQAPGVDTYARTMLERAKNSNRKAQSKLRNVKVLIGILDEIAGREGTSMPAVIEDAVNVAVAFGKEMDAGTLKQVFRKGDLKNLPAVAKAIEVIEDFSNDEKVQTIARRRV